MATINGKPVNFGFKDGGTQTAGYGIQLKDASAASILGTFLQSEDHSKAADVESARNGTGDIATRGWYDQRDEATLEWIVVDETNQAGAITNTSLAQVIPGAIINIVGCQSDPTLVGTNWEVQSGPKITKTNTGFARISVPIHKRALITAVAS